MARLKFKSIFYILISVLLITILWGYIFIWRSPEYMMVRNNCQQFERILTMEDYGSHAPDHPRPFIVKDQNLLIFGSEHTKNPDDPQLVKMKSLFYEFNPTVVLVEGRLGFLIPYFMDPVEQFGEMGWAASLARSHDKKLYSWDPPKNEILDQLNKYFTPEQIAFKEILTPYFSNLRFGKPASPEDYVAPYLERASWLGVQEQFASIDDVDRKWKKDFQEEKDWRDISDQWGLPGYLGQIADQSNYIRNQHLMCGINSLVNRGEKVFVVCGSSHAVCINPEILEE